MPPRYYRGRRRRFGTGRTRTPVRATQLTMPQRIDSKTGKEKFRNCVACKQRINSGDSVTKLTLSKAYRTVCSCGRKRVGTKYYHESCTPTDLNQAMGYDPAQAPTAAAVPPPPKPKTQSDLDLAALAAFEACVLNRAQSKGITPEMRKAFGTFQNIKARVLRPSTEGEGEAATNVALKRIVDMVFKA